ncbi:MAG: hypothetical protein JNJ41_02495 [Bacteroidia bacterium]|nr:hypothetical protein [Bacteroidia bacterium]
MNTTEKQLVVKASFDTILKLTSFSEVLVNIPTYHIKGAKATFKKFENGGLDIKIENVRDVFEKPIDLEVLIGDDIYYIYGLDIVKRATQVSRKEGESMYTGTLTHYGHAQSLKININGNFKNNDTVYYRYITPSYKNAIHYYLETETFSIDETRYRHGKFSFSVDGISLDMYETQYEKKTYLIIDSTSPITLDGFSKICHSVMIAYGLPTATFHQNECYFLNSRDADFANISSMVYQQLRPTIASIYNPIYSNPRGYTDDNDLIKKFGVEFEVIKPDFFSMLCTRVHKEESYATLILLVLEANAASLILKPAGYSVALEKLTNIIVEENKGLKPIADKVLAGKFKDDLKAVLKVYADKITANGTDDPIKILTKNIDKINNPTNRDKLIKPFEIYEIKLNDYDIQAIDHRNNFLHGRHVNMKENATGTDYLEVFHVSLRLNALVNKLIFKHLGYKGWLVNYVKRHENQFSFPIEEELFIEI